MKLQYRYWNDGLILRRDAYFKFRGEWILESMWYRYDRADKWEILQ